jgi:hypothetical protein
LRRTACRIMRADEPALTASTAFAKHYQSTGTFIVEGNDASQFGIGIVAARITELAVREERGGRADEVPRGDWTLTRRPRAGL